MTHSELTARIAKDIDYWLQADNDYTTDKEEGITINQNEQGSCHTLTVVFPDGRRVEVDVYEQD